VPAHRGALRVALHERLDQRLRLEARQRRAARAQWLQPRRQRLRPLEMRASLVVVVQPVVPRRPARGNAVHHDFVEVELEQLD
jgi:hypothetical protein